jgi:hypothetical protein
LELKGLGTAWVVNMAPIKDQAAKAIFLDTKHWPRITSVFSRDSRVWIQCRPKRTQRNFSSITFPHIHTAGSEYDWIDPDCFYIRVSGKGTSLCCDVICAEVSNANQNFQQKRGRYLGTEAALFVNLPHTWLNMPVDIIKKFGFYIFQVDDRFDKGEKIPIRTLRVMYFLDPTHFKSRLTSVDPRPWEYFLPNTSISSLTSHSMRDFVKAISPDAQFYGW